jgi:iron only hydrogenase large subunit-like protein
MVEVALGADVVTFQEAQDFIELVPNHQQFAINSCCSAFRTLVEKQHPKIKGNLFDSLSPMVVTGQVIKGKNSQAKVVFIGPCLAKKMEALQGAAREAIDGVLTFEEIMAIFRAANIDLKTLVDTNPEKWESSRTGRLFARAGGMTEALISTIKKMAPEKLVEPVRAEGLQNCEKLLRIADAGRLNGNLIEGMACNGGCVGGPGTLIKGMVASKLVNDYSQKSPYFYSMDNPRVKEWQARSGNQDPK